MWWQHHCHKVCFWIYLHQAHRTRAEETSAGLARSLFLSCPPCQQFESEMANFVPDKKGRIIFSDAVISRVRAGTLSEGVPEPQVTGRQTNTRWQPFVTNYETPSAVAGGGTAPASESHRRAFPCVNSGRPLGSPRGKPVLYSWRVCLIQIRTYINYRILIFFSRTKKFESLLKCKHNNAEYSKTILWNKHNPELGKLPLEIWASLCMDTIRRTAMTGLIGLWGLSLGVKKKKNLIIPAFCGRRRGWRFLEGVLLYNSRRTSRKVVIYNEWQEHYSEEKETFLRGKIADLEDIQEKEVFFAH